MNGYPEDCINLMVGKSIARFYVNLVVLNCSSNSAELFWIAYTVSDNMEIVEHIFARFAPFSSCLFLFLFCVICHFLCTLLVYPHRLSALYYLFSRFPTKMCHWFAMVSSVAHTHIHTQHLPNGFSAKFSLKGYKLFPGSGRAFHIICQRHSRVLILDTFSILVGKLIEM